MLYDVIKERRETFLGSRRLAIENADFVDVMLGRCVGVLVCWCDVR